MQISGKTVVITGGGRGIGRELAKAFAAKGGRIAAFDLNQADLDETVAQCKAQGVEARGYVANVTDEQAVIAAMDAIVADLGSVDVLINNAGMSPLYPSLDEVTEELFDKVIGVNLKGPFRLSANVGKRMMEGNGGAIINVSSTASVRPSPHAEPYGASKAGLNAITQSFAHAYGPKVRVNCIMAGPFLTDISKAWDMEAFEKRAEENIPLMRGGQPQEITGAALYLASDAASFTTGAILAVDGGAH